MTEETSAIIGEIRQGKITIIACFDDTIEIMQEDGTDRQIIVLHISSVDKFMGQLAKVLQSFGG
jgi:hypothetical protein